jgi:hypothetical protein
LRKIINTYSIALTVTIMLLSLSASIFGQENTQIVQGCSASPYLYPPDRTYIYEMINGQRKLVKIDRIDTGDSRFVFTFRPNSVAVIQGDKITFTTNTFAGDVNLQRKSQLAEEDFAPLNWNETILGNVGQTGDWYVIYQKAEDFIVPADAERYLVPVKNLPADSAEMSVFLQPQNLYSFGGVTVPTPASVNSVVKRLNGLTLDTKDMKEGKYWFTLQSNAVFPGQTGSPCAKTTPPVLIEIKPYIPPVYNTSPTVKITKIYGEGCVQRTITADVHDDDNMPGSKLKQQNLSLTWRIINSKGVEVKRIDKRLGTNPDYTESITENLTPGRYTVYAEVEDDFKPEKGKGSDYREFIIECANAGVVYFQFDEPFDSPDRNAPYKLSNYFNPESWIAYNGRVKVKNQCTIGEGFYPRGEFEQFYTKSENPIPPLVDTGSGTRTQSNTDKLNAIIDALGTNSDYKIHLAGYADFRNSEAYNRRLVERRLQVVKNYLFTEVKKKYGVEIADYRFTNEMRANNSDLLARSCDVDACYEGRRHDRRVELIYYTTENPFALPNYDPSPCPVNALIPNGSMFEWEMTE